MGCSFQKNQPQLKKDKQHGFEEQKITTTERVIFKYNPQTVEFFTMQFIISTDNGSQFMKIEIFPPDYKGYLTFNPMLTRQTVVPKLSNIKFSTLLQSRSMQQNQKIDATKEEFQIKMIKYN